MSDQLTDEEAERFVAWCIDARSEIASLRALSTLRVAEFEVAITERNAFRARAEALTAIAGAVLAERDAAVKALRVARDALTMTPASLKVGSKVRLAALDAINDVTTEKLSD